MEKIKKLFEEIPFAGNQSPKTRLLYVKNMSPRHPFFTDTLEVGKKFLECVLNTNPPIEVGDIYLVFPERWLTFLESRNLRWSLEHYPKIELINSVNIITSSFEIIASYDRDQTHSLDSYF